jgi:hypothetical protein
MEIKDIIIGFLRWRQNIEFKVPVRDEDVATMFLIENPQFQKPELPSLKGLEEKDRACPCLYLDKPCSEDCTCKNQFSSAGCSNCCTYGSLEQRKAKALYLTSSQAERGVKEENQDVLWFDVINDPILFDHKLTWAEHLKHLKSKFIITPKK